MKKSFVAVLVLLALVVLLSPGSVGRLAEQSMDESLDRAPIESADVVITSQGFDRGWFSSEGQHRVDIKDGDLSDFLRSFMGPASTGDLPAIVIDTRLDHGLIPLTSISRDHGSLMPGLGSAVSTVRLEFASGETVGLPGAIYSKLSITGELESKYLLEPGAQEADGGRLTWGASEVKVTSDPLASDLVVLGKLGPLSFESAEETLQLGNVALSIDQDPSPFGFPVGNASLTVDRISVVTEDESLAIGPVSFMTAVSVRQERVSGATRLRIDNAPLEQLGAADIVFEMRLEDADGMALGRVRRSLETAGPDNLLARAQLEADVQRLLAAGLELHVDRLDVELPSGQIAVQSALKVPATDSAEVSWGSLLLGLDASFDVVLPADFVSLVTEWSPDATMLIGLGYLRRNGDSYEMRAGIKNGVLTINGAPMQIPMNALQ